MSKEDALEKASAPAGWSGNMCPELSAPTKVRTSEQSSTKRSKLSAHKPPLFLSLNTDGLKSDASLTWEENGALLGEFSTLSFGECPSVESASHLSLILEASPHPKYSLSAKACLGILRRAERRGKPLPPILRAALERQASASPSTTKPPATTGGGTTRQNDGAGNGLGIGVNGDPSPTLTAGDRHGVAIGINDDIAGTLDASYYKGCGARAGTEREVVLAPVAIPVENHPQDSRVKLSADGTVQTLSGQMGTGGGMFH